ncbi:type IV secretion system protein B4 [Aliivibrio sp. S4TY2]|uniref:VirB4 family type IV secretion system protein n=1 Tax=unclassified Aliivibrio TaxID=2645654 RepID=UPI002378BCD4|nr:MULTISPECIES: type IV secretion system protein B4 [unclassified Aliivibrio]MDD9158089.1 type IV secretion system protein B4 [Aliivibrio sp. S4TY2]MDD9162004.1 type IV secretion system protein B4 [Aliivibrio sp. S4TY1]MDD9166086.1 type IV secretion system protein B4 [Aliivibrio sp. S4MY2]MDD9170084.1 type IV secretion system protein B4 [Aliivibrio sp. S4MY4]MDD9187110.1 type IV secretion system protein B4 [Aliivibrio sp. S4MY3]
MAALNQFIHTFAAMNSVAITDTGSVIGVLELSGVEPAMLSNEDKSLMTRLLRGLIQRLPVHATLTQYYFHQNNAHVSLLPRNNPRAQLVSTRRAHFLNHTRDMNRSNLYWAIEIAPSSALNSKKGLIASFFQALVDKNQRQLLLLALSHRECSLIEEREFLAQCDALNDTLDKLVLGLSFRSLTNTRLNDGSLFFLQKALVQLSPRYLQENAVAPRSDWDKYLATVEVTTVIVEGVHYLKIGAAQPVYARIASVQGVGMETVPESAWASELAPVLEKGNYLLFTRFTPFTTREKHAMVSAREGELYRSQVAISDLVLGTASAGAIKEKMNANPRLKETLSELDTIAHDSDKYGLFNSSVVIFDTSVALVRERVKRLNSVLENAEFHLLWESIGLVGAYTQLLLGATSKGLRTSTINTTQAAALSLFYRSNEGLPLWDFGRKKEEAVYILEGDDGVPFHYTPFVGDKCLVIGVGPTRSGKTFLKNCIATHFSKLGGMYCAMDIDQGSEPVARFFKEDGAIFRLSDTQTTDGFNPFMMASGPEDDAFHRHMMGLIRLMLQENDAVELQTLTSDEQAQLDHAILTTMSQETPELKNFSAMLGQCSPSVHKKLAYFKRGGLYGNLFDNDVDAIGVLDKPFSVYNTEGVKDYPKLATLVNTELFFRAVRLFENPLHRERAKFLEVDECQYVLSQKGAAEFLIKKARTWFKHGGGMGFWTQSPKHYSALEEWSTLRSAATTFIFMSDKEMEEQEYKDAFPFLTSHECDIILNLIPRKQAFIKQMDIGVAKIVNLHVEPEQYVIATSRPHEAALAQRIYGEESDIDVAIDRIVNELGLRK